MNLSFDTKLADEYTSTSQKIRVLTEDWVDRQVYCPNCGHLDIDKYGNNKPVADFFCSNCREDYDLRDLSVLNFLVIPKHFFVPEIIEKRKALSQTARRAGWVGCNILLQSIPQTGKIFFVKNRQ